MKRLWLVLAMIVCLLAFSFVACDVGGLNSGDSSSITGSSVISGGSSDSSDSGYNDDSSNEDSSDDIPVELPEDLNGIPEYPDLELGDTENENEDQWWKDQE